MLVSVDRAVPKFWLDTWKVVLLYEFSQQQTALGLNPFPIYRGKDIVSQITNGSLAWIFRNESESLADTNTLGLFRCEALLANLGEGELALHGLAATGF